MAPRNDDQEEFDRDPEEEDEGPSGLERMEAIGQEIDEHKVRIASMQIPADQPLAALLRDEMCETILPLMTDALEACAHAVMDLQEEVYDALDGVGDDDDEDPDASDDAVPPDVADATAQEIATLLGALRLTATEAAAHATDPAQRAAAEALIARTDAALVAVVGEPEPEPGPEIDEAGPSGDGTPTDTGETPTDTTAQA